jgi:hypothetical protein
VCRPLSSTFSSNNIEKREAASLKQAEKAIDAINNKVGYAVQCLYDKFSTIFPCEWDGTSIVVLKDFIIEAPYQTVRVAEGKAGRDGLDRVIKIVSFLIVSFGTTLPCFPSWKLE